VIEISSHLAKTKPRIAQSPCAIFPASLGSKKQRSPFFEARKNIKENRTRAWNESAVLGDGGGGGLKDVPRFAVGLHYMRTAFACVYGLNRADGL
jgi:hypothetical protein